MRAKVNIPLWMNAMICDEMMEYCKVHGVLPTDLVYPADKDRKTVEVRWGLIKWMHETFAYKRA